MMKEIIRDNFSILFGSDGYLKLVNFVQENNFKKIHVNWNKSNGFKIPNPFYVVKINIEGLDYEISMEKGNKKIRFKRLKKINH